MRGGKNDCNYWILFPHLRWKIGISSCLNKVKYNEEVLSLAVKENITQYFCLHNDFYFTDGNSHHVALTTAGMDYEEVWNKTFNITGMKTDSTSVSEELDLIIVILTSLILGLMILTTVVGANFYLFERTRACPNSLSFSYHSKIWLFFT